MGNLRQKLQVLCFTLLFGVLVASAQGEIRYVKVNGDNSKDGTSWVNAKADIQEAINDLVNNNKTGEVWVAEGTYYPTETTESSGSQYYKAFKIPAGITVRGGFQGDEATADARITVDDKNFGKGNDNSGTAQTGTLDGEEAKSGVYKYKTVLCGDLSAGKHVSFTWNTSKKQFDATFYGNSYHVVWFAMNGFGLTGRANGLEKPAKLEGCVVEGGHAYTSNAMSSEHPHEGYGGGIYMVANSFVYNCEVRYCDASRNGGGIYMDGGGIVRRTLVHDCQALGLGTDFGYGGGICENGGALTTKTNPVVVAQSAVTNCVGRMGGGMALLADETAKANKDHKYAIVANSTLVNNNTAQIEAGGVYTYGGGGLASMTIVRNKCNGSGITQNGQITGRSGGVYSRDASYIGNTVIWGNECEANKDIQYADSRTSLSDTEKTKFYYSALSKADIADWSKSEKMGVLSLDDANTTEVANKGNKGYPLFENPTTQAGYFATSLTGGFDWKVFSESALHHAGINTADLDYEGLTPAPQGKSYDMQFGEFNSRCTMGAIVSEEPLIDSNNSIVSGEAHFFVDPNYNFAQHHGTEESKIAKGQSWDLPTRFLGNVLEYINEDRKPTGKHEFDNLQIFIHVKQGTVDNTDSYKSGRVRCTSLDIPSNVTILGSYNSQLTGTDLSLRNVVHTPTVISAQLMNNYDYNIAHLVNINNQHDILIEGFKISFANANSTKLGNTNKDGAAITVVNSEDIKFRNIVVSNCTADHGAAVYADKSVVEFENCIFHNNASTTIANSGIVYATNGAILDFNHCDVLRNVGHASYLGSNGTRNHWQNSIFYGNLDRPLPDTNTDTEGANTYALAAFSGNTANATGAYCMFDAKSASFESQFGGNDTGNQWQYNLQYKFADGTGQGYPRFINPTKNSGVTEDGDQTYYGRGVSFEPHNNNPIVNMASHADIHTSWGTDLVYVTRDFGGLPDIGAVENHEANQFEEGENAYTDGQKAYGDAYYVRDYASGEGTSMDTYDWNSTTKKYEKNTAGKGIYNAAGELLDGASWEYAVNGNGYYTSEMTEEHKVNTVFKTKVTTTEEKFAGTFTIKNGNYYIYLDGNTPKLTQTAANATHFEVEGVTTSTMSGGSKYIRAKVGNDYRYLWRNNGNTSTSTSATNKIDITAVTGGFTLIANGRYYYRNNGSLSTPSQTTSGYRTVWTFTADMTPKTTTGTEEPYKQDGVTKVTSEAIKTVAADAEVTKPLDFHVYKSLEEYNNSTEQKTYKIKRVDTNHYLRNSTNTTYANYLYPDATKANGHDFILIQDGEYGKYYLYDTNTKKYIYYYTGTGGTSRLRAGSDANKTTWWIDEVSDGVLNFVYGGQPWTTTGNYAMTATNGTTTAVSVGAKNSANAKFVLVANQAYSVYNYTESGTAEVTLNGLQYAVNSANEKFREDNKSREVKVGKGIYTHASPADGDNTVSQPYAYMMKEGVNVYGGFPENGNPGMNERQPKTFETILQPNSKNPYVTMSFPANPSSTEKNYMNISAWGDYISNTNGNEPASMGRVLVQPKNFDKKTSWDGFTIRHGYLHTAYMYNIGAELKSLVPADIMAAGGAGVLLQENGILTNCIVKNNMIVCYPNGSNLTKLGDHKTTADANSLYTYHMSGAGVFMGAVVNPSSRKQVTGIGAVVENCEIANNQIVTKAYKRTEKRSDNIWMYGAGIYQNGGNVYNTIIHDNDAVTLLGNANASDFGTGEDKNNEMILGSGTFVASGNFYNNTIVNNLACTLFHNHDNHCSFAGVHVFDDAKIYNSIIADNSSHWGYEGWNSGTKPGNGVPVSAFLDTQAGRTSRDPSKVHVTYSYVDVNVGAKTDAGTTKEALQDLVSQNDEKHTNVYKNRAQFATTTVADNTYTSNKIYRKNGAAGTTTANMYHIFVESPAFNSGTEEIANVDIPDYDAEYTDRIKDCAIDMGAYEFNGAELVKPQTTGVGVGTDQAIFYVTHNGFGDRSAKDPANAACAAKLQTVLDAAGRYKYLNPGKQVIVKVANDWEMAHAAEPENFTYYATRTTDQTDQDVRVWSIMVPRGVEVWGGYTDVPTFKDANGNVVKNTSNTTWSNTNNGFTYRSITANPTYFDSYYVNKLEKTEANTYHVVTFTDRVFDTNGVPYLAGEESKVTTGAASGYHETGGNDESIFLHMSTKVSGNVIMADATTPKLINGSYASNRAVIDGIFVSGGQADAASGNNSAANINSYGGAALVNDFAYVRNCVLTGNSATNGGALALTDRALVSGCLIMDNEASNQGGGIYVFENGTKLSNGTTINTSAGTDEQMDWRMPHVFTSTIVANIAQQGGGVWFTSDVNSNARFNSVAVWQNDAADQANVHGMVNPEQPTEDETVSEVFYPFSYSIIQDVRASGTNNLDAMGLNNQGVRFVNKNHDVDKGSDKDQTNIAEEKNEVALDAKLADFGYYGLTTYSMLCSNGMPNAYYNELKKSFAIADDDIMGTNRVDNINNFVEIGARALPKRMPNKQLMLRLFVAHPDVVDTETATRFMRLTGSAQSKEEYYSQMGSSFAYPFNFLQDAIDYITRARNGQIADLKLSDGSAATSDIVRNLPFEIVLGSGTYYPTQSLNGGTESVWAHTFAIPEGVTIIGGFNPLGGGETYYGRYYKKGVIADGEGDIYTYVTPIPDTSIAPGGTEVGRGNKFGSEQIILPAVSGDAEHANKVAKTITFQQWHIQDIADRRAMADNNNNGIIEPWEFANQTIISGNAVNGETDGVYHIMTAVADADAVGLMPKVQSTNSSFTETGYQVKEEGQQIRLNGLIITGGNALTYLSTALDEYGKYIFYQGAGLQVDGNRYKNPASTGDESDPVFHNSAAYGVGYRDIPVSVTNCQFRNNIAGYGGAISSNGSLSIFGSSFEQNMAVAATERPDGETWTGIGGASVSEVNYPGQGGAILATYQLSAFNTLFANNEAAYNDKYYIATAPTAATDLFSHKSFRVPGGGAGTLRAAGGAIMMGSAANHHIVNCDFVRNKANAYPAVFTMNPTKQQPDVVDTHDYSQIINTVAWGNEVNAISSDANYLRASKLMVNIGRKNRTQNYITSTTANDFYDPSFAAANVPNAAALASDNAESGDWQEAAWFCAYEEGVGFTPNNTNDLRETIEYSAGKFAPKMIKDANNNSYQNCNLLIVADNGNVDGPNFGNPSVKAGYEGFMEGADWSPARFNKLTDNGNGWIKQKVTTTADDVKVTFYSNEALGTGYQGAYPYTHYISDIVTGKFPEYKLWLAIGNEKYMEATSDKQTEDVTINGLPITRQKNLPRISPDPTIGVTKAYIDIGVYEYQKEPLLKPGNEVDILWVSTKEKPENGPANGLTWKTPTSDLQKAIETLLTSRNGHKKEIRIMEGDYAPVASQTIGGTRYNAFVIDTKSLNDKVITPSSFIDGNNNDQYYAQSITIKGGYSSEIMYEYDPVKYKTVIRQKESGDGSNTDHLIYIADPTLRYAGTKTTNDGATFGSSGESATAKTMPIQIDGITLINNKATAETAGSAIYYPDVTPTSSHSVNVGADVVYYTDGKHTTKSGNDGKDETDYPSIEGGETMNNPAKIVITKAHVIGSGNTTSDEDATKASAVYIGQNGGHALIYNTVFHSNYGMPLNAWNTVNVNNTFGLNAGKVLLNGTASEMHNSALWKNNKAAEGYGEQFSGATSFTYNSYTGCASDANNNTSLSDVNSNIGEGPNFIDPENADIEARSFDLKPSMRLLNQGNLKVDEGLYYDRILHYNLGNDKYAPYDYALISTADVDAANRARFKNNIDLGAYEFQGSLFGILYVDPNKSHKDSATGENWEQAFGYGDLQNAMDLAAIYHASTPTEEAYVFVKGASSTNKKLNTNETLVIRDGVTTYGSIISSYTDWHAIKDEDDNPKYETINDFIKDMTNQREGVASDAASKTIVTGIKTDGDANYDAENGQFPALVDGFVVTNPTATDKPVVDITNPSEDAVIVVRNVVVADNNVTGGANVAQISNGLIYEALFRDNQTDGAVLKVSNNPKGAYAAETTKTRGYAVNVTVEGKTVGADDTMPVDGKDASGTDVESATQIFKSITNSINTGEGANKAGAAAPYGQITNKGVSGYFYNIADPNLNYQLTETSKYIDMCDATNPLTGVADNLAEFINYDTDRDLLGNPRWMRNVSSADRIDRGAFETWRVDKDFVCGKWQKNETWYGTNKDLSDAIAHHFYPHDGSVVYVMESKNLVIDPLGEDEVKPTPENPGFLLVKKGANFYGNGRPVTCAYVAIERDVCKGGSIVGVPFAMNYDEKSSVAKVSKDSNNDLLLEAKTDAAYKYNSEERMDWKYIFKSTNSECWDQISEASENQGVLLVPNGQYYADNADANATALLRFTGKGNSLTDYIYNENGVSKVVTLTKYDDSESTNSGADYTDDLDMGWNCFGLPYLVSEYKPYEKATAYGKDNEFMMHIPHTLWLYYNGKYADGTSFSDDDAKVGDGGYYSVDSWTSAGWHLAAGVTPSIWVGEGIFTQTATLKDTESLLFYRPVAPTSFDATTPAKSLTRYYVSTTGIHEMENADDVNLISTEYYTTDGVRMNNARKGVVNIIKRVYSNGVVKTSKQYVK